MTRLFALLFSLALLLPVAGCSIGLGQPTRGDVPDDDDVANDDDASNDDDATGDDDDATGDDDDTTGDDDDTTGDDDDATGDDDDATADDDDATGDDDDATGDDDDATGDDDDATGTGPQCQPLTTFTAGSGTFDDGSGPGVDYDNSLLCGWLIDVDVSTYDSITIEFPSFDLEQDYDYVYVYDGANNTATQLGQLTGGTPQPMVTSSGTQLYVEFITDSTVTAGGFDASWTGNVTVPGDDDDSAAGDDDDSAAGDDDDATGDDDDSTGPVLQCDPLTTLTAGTGTFDDGSGAGINYDNDLLCGWLIDVDSTLYQDITLSFSSFDLENTFDYLEVYDGPDANATNIGSLTGSALPSDITSTGTQLYVEFITDVSIGADGFEAAWVANLPPPPATCSGTTTLSTGTGSFDDGSGPGANYDNNLSCGWLIDVDSTLYQDITLSFSSFDLENSFDTVTVYDGADATATQLASLTGTSLPSDITSTGTQLFVEFTTDVSVTFDGFDASWVANLLPPPATCSGDSTFTAASGTFDDGSGANNDYSNGVTCGWLIDVDSTLYQDITLSFSAFDVENTWDFVNVYDGADNSATQLGSLTGTALPANITSTGTQLYVEFISDSIISAEGFSAGWTANAIVIPPTCSGTTTFAAPTGSFDDGSGPGANYDNNLSCGWLIDVGAGTYQDITLSFSSFDVENNFDFVSVYDGADSSAPLISALTGTSLPADITSTGTQLFVEFTTDGSVTDPGFDASWAANLLPPPPGCSGTQTLTAAVGFFDDGSGSGDYLANSTCGWLIDVPGMEAVTLEFDSFDTEAGYDFVTIYDGTNASAPIIASYSGSNVPLFTVLVASFEPIFVEFTSDGIIQDAGFDAFYETWGTTDECSGDVVLTDAVGAISDGGGNYANNALCGWTIDVEEAAGIEIEFDFLDTEGFYDVVDIFDGGDDSAALLASYDGLVTPAPLVTTTFGQAFVQLDTDGSVTYPGFTALYSAVYASCSGPYTMTALSGGFGDGLGPNANYVNNQNCTWLIDGPPGSTIAVTAVYWDVESGFDNVELRDGGASSAPLLTTWTGSGSNDTWVTSGSQAFVEWDSDGSVIDPGFWVEYVVIP